MEKKQGKGSTSKKSTKAFDSPARKKLKEGEGDLKKSAGQRKRGPKSGSQEPQETPSQQQAKPGGRTSVGQGEPQHRSSQQAEGQSRSHPSREFQQRQEPSQQQGTWSRGPPSREHQQRQEPSQQQGAWSKGPPLLESQQRQEPSQQQGAWSKGPPSREHQQRQEPSQQQGAWSRGPPPRESQQRQEPSQQQGAWSRGPPSHEPQQRQEPSQQQGAWSKGPPLLESQQRQEPSQQQGAWSRGPLSHEPQQRQEPSQQQGAWSKGPPLLESQQKQEPLQQQGAWSRGPPSHEPQQRQESSQQQGAWSKGPPLLESQQRQEPSQQQGAWSKGPPFLESQQRQEPLQQQGAWSKGPPLRESQQRQEPSQQSEGQSNIFELSKITKSSFSDGNKGKTEKSPQKIQQKKEELQTSLRFAPRITATRKSGRNIVVLANFFPLIISDSSVIVFHYDVIFSPDKPKYLLRDVWNKFVSVVFPGRLTAFDGKNAYSKGSLTKNGTASATITVFDFENSREKEFNVTIEEVRRVSLTCFDNIQEKMKHDHSMKALPEAELCVVEIILRNWASDNFVKSNRNFFPKASTLPISIDLSQKLCMRYGYFQSTFLGYKPYLNFDISHKAFYKEGSILNILDCFRQRHSRVLDIDEMTRFLRKVKVEYILPSDPSSKRTYRIIKLIDDANHQTFTKPDGKQVTVAKYFETEKKCRLNHPNLPLLWVGSVQKSIYLPMEFCSITSDQVYHGVMDSYETKKMVENATSNARDRKRDTEDLYRKTDINNHPLMKEFGFKVSNEMERVPARVLDPPKLKTSKPIRVDGGVWRIQDFLEPVTLKKWCILILDKYVQKQNVINLQGMIKSKGKEFNMHIEEPARAPIDGDPSFTGMKKAFSQLKGMDMVFVIISEVKGVYSRVKAICETQEGILTQCIKSKTVSQDPRKLTTTVQNLLLKVNAKLGGKNHCLHQSSIPSCLNGYVMIVGADVTHPSPGMNIPSVAAITVSCDPAAFQYGTTTRVQPKGEMIIDLEEVMKIHLQKFYEIRKSYPEKIIFFRDGVSEGELQKVFMGELMALRKACGNFCQPKITFVVVQKRHHTRLYPTSSRDEEGKNFNVPAGTCVDSDIVHPRDLDFYLVSHSSILGTARPTRYRLLNDDNKLTDEELETLSYYLCHLFARCNRSVSYPSPTFNAHLAAARVRAYLEGLNLLSCQDVKSIQMEMKDKISGISPMFFV